MRLPVMPPLEPMLAKAVKRIPTAADVPGGLLYEPKWDGFRCVVFRDGDEVELGSRNERPLTRYFPEVVDAVRIVLLQPCGFVGHFARAELICLWRLGVIATERGLYFEALLQRIHPADSRVRRLAAETPASLVAFDLLAIGDESLMETPFRDRRPRLEQALAEAGPPVHLTPATDDPEVAEGWFTAFEGAGLSASWRSRSTSATGRTSG